ncbi:MAG: hypothetical protein QXQ69_01310 [Candidatus Aenigmatarchaeota archaeon]
MMEFIMAFIMVESIITPIITLIILFFALYMAKKFGGMYKKFFIVFAIGWIFQILHSIDETLLVQAMPSMMPLEAMFLTFPEILASMRVPSPLFAILGLNFDFILVKMAFMAVCAVIITYALTIHYKLTKEK